MKFLPAFILKFSLLVCAAMVAFVPFATASDAIENPADETAAANAGSDDRDSSKKKMHDGNGQTRGAGNGAGTGSGKGSGQGGGQGAGKGGHRMQGKGCPTALEIYHDDKKLKSLPLDSLAASPLAETVKYSGGREFPGILLARLVDDQPDFASVAVRACGARTFELRTRQFIGARLYLVQGGSGRWKLADLTDHERPVVLVRNVVNVTTRSEAGENITGGDEPVSAIVNRDQDSQQGRKRITQ